MDDTRGRRVHVYFCVFLKHGVTDRQKERDRDRSADLGAGIQTTLIKKPSPPTAVLMGPSLP